MLLPMRTHDAAAFQLRVQFDSTARELEKLRRENTEMLQVG